MEMLHAVFHGALVGTDFVVTTLQQRTAACVHALADFIVLDSGFHIGRALGFDEIGLKGCDFFG